MIYYINKEFNYLSTNSNFIELPEGQFGWTDPLDNTKIVFGPKGYLSDTTVANNSLWFNTSTGLPNLYNSEPAPGDTVFIIIKGGITSRAYAPSTFNASDKDKDRADYAMLNIHRDLLSASDELSRRVVEKTFIETAIKYNNGWVPNWNDKNQSKWYPVRKYGVVYSESTTDTEVGSKFYFRSKDYCDKAIQELKSISKYLF